MSNEESPPSVEQQLSELTDRLDRLQAELKRDRRPPLVPRPPRAEELRQFTSEVAIPGLILLLETNVRALKLLQRTLRMSQRSENASAETAQRASELGSTALARLDDALAQAQSALEGQPPDSEARELLDEARSLQQEVQNRFEDDDLESIETGPVVDVEAELQSIKDQVDDDDEND
jgi:molecular chaperone GrpE (heat shock protein)